MPLPKASVLLARIFVLVLTLANIAAQPAWPWGEEGHRIVSINAIHLLPRELKRAFWGHIDDMGHYANAPDSVWKRMDIKDQEKPTHYLNSENFKRWIGRKNFPTDPNQAQLLYLPPADKPEMTFVKNGILPWRVAQMQQMLTQDFDNAAHGHGSVKVGLHAGIMSHYVADSVQPFHGTYDFDGHNAGHGGIHSYLESDVVKALSRRHGLKTRSLAIAQARVKQWSGLIHPQDSARTVLALIADSYPFIEPIYRLDERFALLPAEKKLQNMPRRPAAAAAPHFVSIVAERMALGSVALAGMIENAWISAGRPPIASAFGKRIAKPPFIFPPF